MFGRLTKRFWVVNDDIFCQDGCRPNHHQELAARHSWSVWAAHVERAELGCWDHLRNCRQGETNRFGENGTSRCDPQDGPIWLNIIYKQKYFFYPASKRFWREVLALPPELGSWTIQHLWRWCIPDIILYCKHTIFVGFGAANQLADPGGWCESAEPRDGGFRPSQAEHRVQGWAVLPHVTHLDVSILKTSISTDVWICIAKYGYGCCYVVILFTNFFMIGSIPLPKRRWFGQLDSWAPWILRNNRRADEMNAETDAVYEAQWVLRTLPVVCELWPNKNWGSENHQPFWSCFLFGLCFAFPILTFWNFGWIDRHDYTATSGQNFLGISWQTNMAGKL